MLHIYLPPSLQPLVDNKKLISINGGNIGVCLDNLAGQYPALRTALFDKKHTLQKGLSLYFNGENTSVEDFARPVKDGDKLYIINILAGG